MSVEDERKDRPRLAKPKPEGQSLLTSAPTNMVEHPRHYNEHPSGVECITIVRHMNFNLGNVVKYLWRFGKKGPSMEDLRKAAWYLKDEIERLEKEAATGAKL